MPRGSACPRPRSRSRRPLDVPGGHLDLRLAPRGLDRDRRAERGLPRRERQVDRDVPAVDPVPRVRRDPDDQVEVPGGSRRRRPLPPCPASRMRCPSVTPARDRRRPALRDRRGRDRTPRRRGRPPRRSARARPPGRRRAPAPAGPPGPAPNMPPNRSSRSMSSTAATAAEAAAGPGRAPALPGRCRPADPRARAQVSGSTSVRAPAEVRRRTRRSGAVLRVGQHVVGLGDLLEPVLGGRVLVDVGVVLPGQLPVGALDLVLARRPGHPERLVEVACRGISSPWRHDDQRRAAAAVAVAVAGPHARAVTVPGAASPSVRRRHRLVPAGSNGTSGVVAPREAEPGEHVQRLLADRPHALDDRRRGRRRRAPGPARGCRARAASARRPAPVRRPAPRSSSRGVRACAGCPGRPAPAASGPPSSATLALQLRDPSRSLPSRRRRPSACLGRSAGAASSGSALAGCRACVRRSSRAQPGRELGVDHVVVGARPAPPGARTPLAGLAGDRAGLRPTPRLW